MTTSGEVVELWRYPVKSLGGEQLESARVDVRGVEGDRRWAVRGGDGKLGSGKTTRRFRRMPGLLGLSSFLDEDGNAWIRFSDGDAGRVDDPSTSRRVGVVVNDKVEVVAEGSTSHFDDSPLHLLTTASLAWLADLGPADQVDARRFRPNVAIDVPGGAGRVEEQWVGRTVRVGEVVLAVAKPTERCVMTTLAQGDLDFAPGILKRLRVGSDSLLGVYARVVTPGTVSLGDPVEVLG